MDKLEDTGSILLCVANKHSNINLAMEAYSDFLMKSKNRGKDTALVIASISPKTFEDEKKLAKDLKIYNNVFFVCDINNNEKFELMKRSRILLYTNANDYYNTLPIEAVHLNCLVIACNNGAALETISHEYSGFLLPQCPKVWGSQIREIIEAKDE